jgi:hypothetical protein
MINVIGSEEFVTEKFGDQVIKFRKMQWQDVEAACVFLRSQNLQCEVSTAIDFLINDAFGMGLLLERTAKCYNPEFSRDMLAKCNDYMALRNLVDRVADLPKKVMEETPKNQ